MSWFDSGCYENYVSLHITYWYEVFWQQHSLFELFEYASNEYSMYYRP